VVTNLFIIIAKAILYIAGGYLIIRLVTYAVFTSYFQVVIKLFKKEEKENGKEG